MMKIAAAVVAVVLILLFLVPYIVKMKDVALGLVVLIGLGMMAIDLWQSLQSKDD